MTKLLIMTTGQTDVQLVVNGVRKELDGKTCGKLHDEIEKRPWRVVDVPARKDDQRISGLPDGDLSLCTPKLDAVLRFEGFNQELPSAVLILETRRTIDSDPRYAGAVLKQRLRDKGVSEVQRHAFLEDQETLEDPEKDADAVVRGSVVLSLSQAIASAVEQAKPKEVIVATTGGMAAANAVIEELARLYAEASGAIAKVLEVPDASAAQKSDDSDKKDDDSDKKDDDSDKKIDRAVEEKFHPATGIRARWQALSLIRKGNLLAAWGAVSHLENQPGQEWTKVVRWLADFAASLPIANGCDIEVLTHPKMAVRAALRVELALRAGDVPRAVHGTVAFFESALWDWLRQRDFTTEDGASGSIEEGFTFSQGPNKEQENRFRKVTRNGREIWKINDFNKGVKAWLEVLDKRKLRAFKEKLSDDIRELRNDVAHNEPTPELMQKARVAMQDAELWSRDDPPQFLKQPLVQAVLTELGVEEPNLLCEKLLETVRARLLLSPQPASDAKKEET